MCVNDPETAIQKIFDLEESLAEARQELKNQTFCYEKEKTALKVKLDSAVEMAGNLQEALKMLHDETEDYIKINHLGDPHHNQSMKLAKQALALYDHWVKGKCCVVCEESEHRDDCVCHQES